MTKIYLIRHAEAEGNVFRRMDGFYNSRITKLGEQQIAALRQRFEGVQIDAVYSSDLYRTCKTAEAIYVPRQLPLHKDARFREISFGSIEDRNFGWLEHFTPEMQRNFSKAPERWLADGAETFFTATDRFLAGLRDLAERHEGQTIAVFSHGGITGWSMRRLYGENNSVSSCDNTGVCLLRFENGEFTPEYLYDNSHLSEAISTRARQRWWRGTDKFNLWFRPAEPSDAALIDPAFPLGPGVQEIAVRADEPVGYLSYDPARGKITQLYLVPAHRNQRMGDQLIGEIVCPCRDRGLRQLSAAFDPQDPLSEHLLARHGAIVSPGRAVLDIAIPEY